MVGILGTGFISSLGFTTEENFQAVLQGISGIKYYEAGVFDLPEPFMASLIDKERLKDEFARHCGHVLQSSKTRDSDESLNDVYTNLEKASILSVLSANKEAKIDLAGERTIFIISTTKGNIRQLDMRQLDMRYETQKEYTSHISKSQIYLWRTAELIAQFFGNPNTPMVISNACISGAAAQIAAKRELQSGNYDYAVIVGADFLSKFIISGFQSFKALSPELCRPFDKNRCGLNLGEAAAAMIMSNEQLIMNNKGWLVAGAVRNDACHISAPSRTGEGSYRALTNILQNTSILNSQIAFVNAHGTATPYNDAMEMNAIVRAGLQHIPVNSLKSYFGHTLGAAGIVETIISLRALSEGLILKTLGFEENEQLTMNNEQFALPVCSENTKTNKKCFIKMMSGFGGVNAVLFYCHEYTNLH